MIEFEIGSVPVALAAKVMSKDATWVRAGIISGWLPIGVATRDGEKVTDVDQVSSKQGRINFYMRMQTNLTWGGVCIGREI